MRVLQDVYTGLAALLSTPPPPPFGRVRLTDIASEWAEQQTLNPRALANEVAAVLRTLPDNQLLDLRIASAVLFDPSTGSGGITHAALADYFERVSQGTPPATIRTSTGTAQAGAVQLDRAWINRATTEAAQRAAMVAGLVLVANDCDSLSVVVGGTASTSAAPTAQPTGSEPGFLKMRQAQQRQQGEHSAAAQLDAERTARQLLEARLAIKETQNAQLIEECEQHRRAVSDEKRARLEAEAEQRAMEEQLEAAMAVAECLNPENPASPPELRMAFQCWRDITQDGTLNPSAAGGRGCHTLVSDWVTSTRQQLNKDQAARLKAVVSWRKRGAGAIPTQ